MSEPLQTLYANRFSVFESVRNDVWKVLTRYFFQKWVRPTDVVLDLGAGYCEFINNINAGKKYALDLNPATPSKAQSDVTVISRDVLTPWPLPSGSVDVVFTSNCFEHLPRKEGLQYCLSEISRVLRPGGILIALGPNIRYCYHVYWDFFDHHLPLSDRSMSEAIQGVGLEVRQSIPRFLPYTMSGKKPPAANLIRAYLALPLVWPLFGKQFLLVAQNRDA